MAAALEFFNVGPQEAIGSNGTFTLNETTDRIEWPFYPRDLSTLSAVFANIGAISGAPQLRLSLQTALSTGRADGTILGGGSAYVDFSPVANSATWRNLGGSHTPATLSQLVLVLQLVSGTSAVVNYRSGSTANYDSYTWSYDNSTSTATRQAGLPVFGVKSSSTVNGWPIITASNLSWSTTGTTEYGNLFTLPAWSDQVTLWGVHCLARFNASSTGSIRVCLGSAASATTAVQTTVSVVAEQLQTTGSTVGPLRIAFAQPITLASGDSFRLSLQSTAGTVGLGYWDVETPSDFSAWNSWGTAARATSRGTGNWSEVATRVYAIAPIFSDLTKGAGSAAGVLFRRPSRI